MILAPEVETRSRPEQLALDDAAYRTQMDYLFERSAHGGEPNRRAPLCRAVGDRADLLDQRHYRRAQLHPADGGRSRELGDGVSAQLRRLGDRGRGAHRLHLQRWTVRGRRRAGLVRSHRRLSHSGRHRQHRTPDARRRAPAPAGRGAHALLRRVSGRVGRRAQRQPAGLERAAGAGRGGARRWRARLPRPARTGLGRASPRRWDRRHRRLAVGRVRAPGRDAPRRPRFPPRRADRPRDGRCPGARRRGHGRAGADASPAPRGAAAAVSHARPRPGLDEPLPVRPRDAPRALHRPHRRHADRAGRQCLPPRPSARWWARSRPR